MASLLGVEPLDQTLPAAPVTTAAPSPINPNENTADQTLLGVIKRVGDLMNQPLVPDNPLAQLGTALSGFAAGTQGRPNPVLEQYQKERALQIQNLVNSATIATHLGTLAQNRAHLALQTQTEERRAEQHALDAKIKMAEFFGKDPDNEAGQQIMVRMLQGTPGVSIPSDLTNQYVQTGASKTLPARRDAAIAAILQGRDPVEDFGINVSGLNISQLKSMSKEALSALMTPDAQRRLATAADATAKARANAIKADSLDRIQRGVATETDRDIAGLVRPSPDQVVGRLLEDFYQGATLSPDQTRAVKTYLANNDLKGLSGDAQLAMRAARGDTEAQKALDNLDERTRAVTDNGILIRASEIKQKVASTPGYQPSTHEKALVEAADQIIDRKNAKPLPQYIEKRFESMDTILRQVEIIKDSLAKGGSQYLGPIAGRFGKLAEQSGFMSQPERQKLYGAIATVFAEVGPEKFGSQFTEGEQKIVRNFLIEATNPSGNFKVRLDALETMMRAKHANSVAVARENHYRLPAEFVTAPGATSPPTSNPMKKRIEELLLQGKSPQEINAILQSEGH